MLDEPGSNQAPFELRLHDRTIVVRRPLLVGVLNLTPDSFFDGGQYTDPEAAIASARRLILEGADILDIGAESSRPGADPVPLSVELARLNSVLPQILELGAPVSIDTYKPEVAEFTLGLGAHLINDITGLRAEMLEVVSSHKAPAIVMHMAGSPKTMQQAPALTDAATEVFEFLRERIRAAQARDVQTIADVGFGFGKTVHQNLELLRALPRFRQLGVPLLIGTSRKSTLGALTGAAVDDRLTASLATAAHALAHGAAFLRVHDVREHRELIQVSEAIDATQISPARPNTTIQLNGIPVDLKLGVPHQERAQSQRISVDLTLEFPYLGYTDDVADTLDYQHLPKRVQSLCQEEETKLLETLAERIAQPLLRETAASTVCVRIHKPNAASAIGCSDVIVERSFESDRPLVHHAFVALGSNVGDRQRFLDAAISELRRLGMVVRLSTWIETAPEHGQDGPNYLNGVAHLTTELAPVDLLAEFLQIEQRFGRQRGVESSSESSSESASESASPNAQPRTLDLDLLLYDQETIDCEALTVPHPRMHQRDFVLGPLVEIAPDALHPQLGLTAAELLDQLTQASRELGTPAS